MEQKLTAQIAACYPNSLIKTAKFTCKMVGICFDTNELVLRATGGVITDCFVHPVGDCQLLLSTLSAITDEHAIEVVEMHGYDPSKWGKIQDAKITGEKMRFEFEKYIVRVGAPTAISDYLRSVGYDLGYGSTPSLIAAGIAVDKNKM